MNCRRQCQTGLTLVEVLLAMAIMATVLAALAQFQDSGARAALHASVTAEACVLCQSEMDAWMASDRSKVALDTIERLPGNEGWSRRVTVQPLSAETKRTGLALLTIEVFRGNQANPAFSLSRWVATGEPGARP